MKLRLLDTFAGIGGFSLGLEATGFFETVAFCEIEDFPRRVLAKHWPDVYIHDDIRTLRYTRDDSEEPDDWILYDEELDHEIIRGPVDVISGGFPCQDLSLAGNQAGIEGDQSGLWSELARLIGEVRPAVAILENVTALLSGDRGRWFGRVLGDLAALGFDVSWHCIPAASIGAPHRRDRVWIIAFAESLGSQGSGPGQGGKPEREETRRRRAGDDRREMSDTFGERLEGLLATWATSRPANRPGDGSRPGWFAVEPDVRRVVDGLPDRVHRIKALGNAIVPEIAELIGYAVAGHAGLLR